MIPNTHALPMAYEQKLQPQHHERLAVVYVRQSTVGQVQRHRESTDLQYNLVSLAERLGWPRPRILVVDDDLGVSAASAEGRRGFQRLLSEVALDHVGLILGVEMSRLARSCKDWYHLLELCSIFGTLICDLDGLYDPSHYNDRLLLGLKGTMSEAELHILRQRMLQGALNKARRGALHGRLPIGYLPDADGGVIIDPDQQVQTAVQSVFDLFERLGSAGEVLRHMRRQGLLIPVRVHSGPRKGQLEWLRPHQATIHNILHNPKYAGAYVYGRSIVVGKPHGPGVRRRQVKRDEWKVLLRDRYPAYIGWSHYERNVAQLAQNQSRLKARGAVRKGAAWLGGLVHCGRCGTRMRTWYTGNVTQPRYVCQAAFTARGEPLCQSLAARAVDEEVARLALLALAPAALEVSLQVAADLQQQHEKTHAQWKQKLERAQYEVDRARRQYDAVEPENRLVARTLETAWEQKLLALRTLQDEFDRLVDNQPALLSLAEQETIRRLASDLPTLWRAPTTSDADRKNILRQVIDKVVVDVEGKSEWTEARVHWVGGHETYTRFRRPVARLEQLSNWPQIRDRITELRTQGRTVPEIVDALNREHLRAAKQRPFTRACVATWLSRFGLATTVRRVAARELTLAPNEWLIRDLARALDVGYGAIYAWIRRGKIPARQIGGCQGQWIVTADLDDPKWAATRRDNTTRQASLQTESVVQEVHCEA